MAELLPRMSCLAETLISTRSKCDGRVGPPCGLDHETQIVLPSKSDSFLDVFWRSGVDSDDRHAPLSARNAERGVEIAALDGPVGKGPRLPVGVFSGPGLVRTPGGVVPSSKDIGAVSCCGVVARSGWRDRVDQRLRDCRRESLELGIRWPTFGSRSASTVLGWFRGNRCEGESDGQ